MVRTDGAIDVVFLRAFVVLCIVHCALRIVWVSCELNCVGTVDQVLLSILKSKLPGSRICVSSSLGFHTLSICLWVCCVQVQCANSREAVCRAGKQARVQFHRVMDDLPRPRPICERCADTRTPCDLKLTLVYAFVAL